MKPNDDDDDVVRDGEGVRVPVYLIDTVRFEDGEARFLRAVDERSKSANFTDVDAARDAVQAARESWIKQMCDAWKRPPTRDAAEADAGEVLLKRHLRSEPDDNAQALRERAYRNYCDELSRAWQRGRTDPRAATAVERQRRAYTYETAGDGFAR
jgi:hypothetical protein